MQSVTNPNKIGYKIRKIKQSEDQIFDFFKLLEAAIMNNELPVHFEKPIK